MADADFAPRGNAGLPSITELIGLKLRLDSAERAERAFEADLKFKEQGRELSQEGQEFSHANTQVNKYIEKFRGLQSVGQKKMFLEGIKADPDAQRSFMTAGLNPDLVLNPLELTEEEQMEEGAQAGRVQYGIADKTKDEREAFMIRKAQETARAETAAAETPEAVRLRKTLREEKIADTKELQKHSNLLTQANKMQSEIGGYRDPETGKVVPATRLKAAKLGQAFITKKAFDTEYQAQSAFDPSYTVALDMWKSAEEEGISYSEKLKQARISAGRDSGDASRAEDNIQFTERMLKNYHLAGDAKTLAARDQAKEIFHAILLNQELGGRSPIELRKLLAFDRTLGTTVQKPSPYFFYLKQLDESKVDAETKRRLSEKFREVEKERGRGMQMKTGNLRNPKKGKKKVPVTFPIMIP